MLQILPPDRYILALLGKQKETKGVKYRLLSFCISEAVSTGVLLYNNLTKELILIDSLEDIFLNDTVYLTEHWFLVPSDYNDHKLACDITHLLKEHYLSSVQKTSFTVFTTTRCNARCFYCFEKNLPQVDMSEAVAHKVAEYIVSSSPTKSTWLRWFGGEPLCNMPVMDIICKDLQAAGVSYSSSMITNGLLLTSQILPKALELWHLSKVQITLDGSQEIYNKTKNYIAPDRNPFAVVTQNITDIANSGIKLGIRLNIGKHNGEDLLTLLNELERRIPNKTNIFFTFAPLFENAGHKPSPRSAEDRHNIYRLISQLEAHAEMLGFSTVGLRLNERLNVYSCAADNPYAINIAPQGDLYRCEHIHMNSPVGSIDHHDAISTGVWTNYIEKQPECNDCPLFPTCHHLIGCAEHTHCNNEYQNRQIQIVKNRMQYEYTLFQKNI